MAFSTKAFLSLATLLILATSQAHSLTILGVSVGALQVRGGLHCQANPAGVVTGNALPCANVRVALCVNGQPIAFANTDLSGNYIIILNTGSILLNILDISSLTVRVTLPIANCDVWARTTGFLEGPCVLPVGGLVGNVVTLVVNTLHFVA